MTTHSSDVFTPPNVLLSAFGIHAGGGRVLLLALLDALSPALKIAALDERFDPDHSVAPADRVLNVRRSFLKRWQAIRTLTRLTTPGDTLFCFNSLPPLTKAAGRVVVFVQAPHFAGLHQGVRYTMATTIRLFIERRWFAWGVRYCDEVWVQTQSMQAALSALHPDITIRIRPLVDNALLQRLEAVQTPAGTALLADTDFRFFYPADAVGHKNHRTLLLAWGVLAAMGRHPRLVLTLRPEDMDRLRLDLPACGADSDAIENLGWQTRERVLEEMSRSSALIFPSVAETFGLPMLEARASGLPIIASERDFVRDVCRPQETFDPASPRSIAFAVLRFMDAGPSMANNFLAPQDMAQELMR